MQSEVLQSPNIEAERKTLENNINKFVEKYWGDLKSVSSETNLTDLKGAMLADAKNLFVDIPWVDSYEAYQVLAELWQKKLTSDLEIIAANGFYNATMITEPNMVTKGKGKNKHLVQVGVVGRLIPNDLMERLLYHEERSKIDNYQADLDSLEAELSELLEAAKEESSDEYYVLNDLLKRDDDGDVKDTFDATLVEQTLKKLSKKDDMYELVKKTHVLLAEIKKLRKSIKEDKELLNEKVSVRFEMLTHEEVDRLMLNKWFSSVGEDMEKIIEDPIFKELEILSMLNKRYSDTLQSLDLEINNIEKSIDEMMKELVLEW